MALGSVGQLRTLGFGQDASNNTRQVNFELFDSRGRDQRPTRPAGGPSVTVTDKTACCS